MTALAFPPRNTEVAAYSLWPYFHVTKNWLHILFGFPVNHLDRGQSQHRNDLSGGR